MLIHFDGESPQLATLKKYFHVSDELLERWRNLSAVTRHHQYLDRTCIDGLEFFKTRELADVSFKQIDRILLPQITEEQVSRLAPATRSQTLLRLGEQSAFFQIWPDHTKRQWGALATLANHTGGYHVASARDFLADPERVALLLGKAE